MITKEHYERLKSLIGLRSASNAEAQEIVKYYRMFINPGANVCATCPDSLAPAFSRLKEWFNNNEQNLLNTLMAKTDKKKMDVQVVDKKELIKDGSETNTDNKEVKQGLQSSTKENKKSGKSKKTLE